MILVPSRRGRQRSKNVNSYRSSHVKLSYWSFRFSLGAFSRYTLLTISAPTSTCFLQPGQKNLSLTFPSTLAILKCPPVWLSWVCCSILFRRFSRFRRYDQLPQWTARSSCVQDTVYPSLNQFQRLSLSPLDLHCWAIRRYLFPGRFGTSFLHLCNYYSCIRILQLSFSREWQFFGLIWWISRHCSYPTNFSVHTYHTQNRSRYLIHVSPFVHNIGIHYHHTVFSIACQHYYAGSLFDI